MKRTLLFIATFILWTLIGSVSKVAFMAMYSSLMESVTLGDWWDVVWHGLVLDMAIGGYLTLVPGLLLIVGQWWHGKGWLWTWRTYFLLTSFVAAVAYVSNLGLYAYWGFPLDNTPLLYIRTSPSDAMASLTLVQMVVAPLAIIALTVAVYLAFDRLTRRILPLSAYSRKGDKDRRFPFQKVGEALLQLILMAALILPIRGGVSTGTNHTGNVYFSNDIRKNHAAVNPIFCFVESVMHQSEDLATKYRFMDDDRAARLMQQLTCTTMRTAENTDSAAYAIQFAEGRKANVVVIMLESFSNYIMDRGGHVRGVTPNLDRLAAEGISFSRFYANSVRTDRAITAILSGLPAQPTMTVMDVPHISNSLPSMALSLQKHGYSTSFYYGGDTGYSNMHSYLVATGYGRVVSEKDFTRAQRTGKWGAPDGTVLDRMLQDIKGAREPFFTTIMTASSHEPFDVPYSEKASMGAELNAFAYADKCLGDFISGLRALPCWENTLVVIVPDHLGAYPTDIDNYQLWRYELPLILTGGVVKEHRDVPVIGCQADICATVLALLGIDHSAFTYSKDLLDTSAPHYAFFTFPDAMGMVTPDGAMIYDNTSARQTLSQGASAASMEQTAKALLQKLYDDLAKR